MLMLLPLSMDILVSPESPSYQMVSYGLVPPWASTLSWTRLLPSRAITSRSPVCDLIANGVSPGTKNSTAISFESTVVPARSVTRAQ